MTCNVGPQEKYVRLVFGVMLFAVGLYAERNFSGTAGQILLWLSLSVLLTAAFRWCPLTWARLRLKSSSNPSETK